ncbi:MAG TPA: hypothetical protein VFZ66_27935 [Herpetosiphonaceae bacterium]
MLQNFLMTKGFTMAVTDKDVQRIQNTLAPLIGQPAWGVSLGIGSFITLEFGAPTGGGASKHIHGEWHLWIYYCAWRLEQGDQVLAGSEDPRPKMESAVRQLEGLDLQAVDLVLPGLDTIFTFGNGFILRIFPVYSEEHDHWMLYTPDNNVLVLGPGTNWSYISKSSIPA